ncbi:MAG TPA: VWA domain-containing protein [Actinomycetota bacterium]|nr:VWA domain-containing protein [Actinomycetota bacterium]
MSPVIILVAVVVVIAVVYLFGLKPEPARGRRPAPALLRRRSRWRKILPALPLVAAVGCLALAFTGFRFNVDETAPTIVLVMDVSDSMDATDVVPNRLAAAESAATAFLDELPPDFRVGLATFASSADLAVVPTREREEIVAALGELSTSRGTLIGDGLSVALDAIAEIRRDAQDTPAAALLLSDGRDTGSQVSPEQAAERARSLAVPVFTVVVGQVVEGDDSGADRATLEAIARISGGETFAAEDAGQLTARFENIGSELSVDLVVEPATTPLVVAAIGLTVLAGILLVLTPR